MRSMLEAEHENKRKDMNRMMMEYNKKLNHRKRTERLKQSMMKLCCDTFNIAEAENTRNTVYSKLKSEIDQAKQSI